MSGGNLTRITPDRMENYSEGERDYILKNNLRVDLAEQTARAERAEALILRLEAAAEVGEESMRRAHGLVQEAEAELTATKVALVKALSIRPVGTWSDSLAPPWDPKPSSPEGEAE